MTIAEIIAGLGEESTAEELRRAIADIGDTAQALNDDIAGFKSEIDRLTADNERMSYEIANLKEENGRLFRERIAVHSEQAQASVDKLEKTIDEQINELEDAIKL